MATTISTSPSERAIHVSIGDKVELWVELCGTTRGAGRHYATIRSTLGNFVRRGNNDHPSSSVGPDTIAQRVCHWFRPKKRRLYLRNISVNSLHLSLYIFPITEVPRTLHLDADVNINPNVELDANTCIVIRNRLLVEWRIHDGRLDSSTEESDEDEGKEEEEYKDQVQNEHEHEEEDQDKHNDDSGNGDEQEGEGDSDDDVDGGNEEVYKPTSPVMRRNPPRKRCPLPYGTHSPPRCN
ncbi:prostatic spermine-binding protein-like [Gossypium australe]|uniref:Prostatic spermine-binding protein-like n=1 Tax=Gossypium australe TaxID=47621 RepID=A0A5B6U7L3_9ROSI|nr:prostatic spermine-binding protein-like [Gossypium australe]